MLWAEMGELVRPSAYAELPRASEADSGSEPPNGDIVQIVDNLSFQNFKDNIQILSDFGDRSDVNGQPSPSNIEAGAWLEEQLEAMGYQVEWHDFTYSDNAWSNLYVTKVGTTRPDQMYIISAHFDGTGGGGAADADASGCSLVLEAARAMADSNHTKTESSVRFIFWNAGDLGRAGSRSYVQDRLALQGIEEPAGSGIYPEPTWLGIINHDLILFDHGVPAEEEQIPEADLDIAWTANSIFGAESIVLAGLLLDGNARYSTDYPAERSSGMSSTDSVSFAPHTLALSVRENRWGSEIGLGGNPHCHGPTDVFETYSEADFRLGFNALQMTVGSVCELVGCASSLDPIFEDGFESGDTASWSSTAP